MKQFFLTYHISALSFYFLESLCSLVSSLCYFKQKNFLAKIKGKTGNVIRTISEVSEVSEVVFSDSKFKTSKISVVKINNILMELKNFMKKKSMLNKMSEIEIKISSV